MLASFYVRVREGYGGIQPRELGHDLDTAFKFLNLDLCSSSYGLFTLNSLKGEVGQLEVGQLEVGQPEVIRPKVSQPGSTRLG